MRKILIIDDEEKLRTLLARIIGLDGFDVFQAGDFKTAFKVLDQENIDVILCDVKLPDGNGVEMVPKIKEKSPFAEIILLTAFGNIPDGIQAIKMGAFDYLTKGDDNNRIIPLLHRALEKAALTQRVHQLEKQLDQKYSFDYITGHSRTLNKTIELAKKVAPTDTTVLLTGETGTGKEVFAQAIHQQSTRRKHNFVAINCSAFSRDLLEGEMFGHKAGAFTGALKDQKGLFEEANNGTIFLDEIGEMPLELQAKLLRVLETGEFFKIGESKATKVNVRIIAATNRNLLLEIEKGNFREDLYYRISVFQIPLPPLRARIADIELLAGHFLEVFSAKTNKTINGISSEVIESLKAHPWNGNIRELKNVIERAVILCNDSVITTECLPPGFNRATPAPAAFDLASVEHLHIQKVLNYTNGNKTKAAELLGIALTTLYRKLAEYGLG